LLTTPTHPPTHPPTRVLPIQFIYLNKKIKIEVPDPVEVNAISWNREQVSESHTNTFNSFTVVCRGSETETAFLCRSATCSTAVGLRVVTAGAGSLALLAKCGARCPLTIPLSWGGETARDSEREPLFLQCRCLAKGGAQSLTPPPTLTHPRHCDPLHPLRATSCRAGLSLAVTRGSSRSSSSMSLRVEERRRCVQAGAQARWR
jgi:hypothetical protein